MPILVKEENRGRSVRMKPMRRRRKGSGGGIRVRQRQPDTSSDDDDDDEATPHHSPSPPQHQQSSESEQEDFPSSSYGNDNDRYNNDRYNNDDNDDDEDDDEDVAGDFSNFANPSKVQQQQPPPQQRPPDMRYRSPSPAGSSASDNSRHRGGYNNTTSNNNVHYRPPVDRHGYQRVERPSAGYNSLEDEAADLLYKLKRMEDRGVRVSKKYHMGSRIADMRAEYERIRNDAEVDASVKFSRKMLVACTSGIEFLNKRYDPLNIHLDGWSEHIMEDVGQYDQVFEKLHEKYKSEIDTPPELELMLSLAGSAFMFHLSHTMMKSFMPNMSDIQKQNPELISNLLASMSQNVADQAGKTNNTPPPPPQQMPPPPSQQMPPPPSTATAQQQQQYSMRGPPFNLMGGGGGGGDMLSTLMGNNPMMMPDNNNIMGGGFGSMMMPPPMPTRTGDATNNNNNDTESVSSNNTKNIHIDVGGNKRRKRDEGSVNTNGGGITVNI